MGNPTDDEKRDPASDEHPRITVKDELFQPVRYARQHLIRIGKARSGKGLIRENRDG